MAYANRLTTECTEMGCTRDAIYVVKNRRNEEMRRCCQRHAEQLVRQLSAEEDRADERGRS